MSGSVKFDSRHQLGGDNFALMSWSARLVRLFYAMVGGGRSLKRVWAGLFGGKVWDICCIVSLWASRKASGRSWDFLVIFNGQNGSFVFSWFHRVSLWCAHCLGW